MISENGLVMYIWLGSQLDPTFVQYVFGLQAASQIQSEKVEIRVIVLTCMNEVFVLFQCRVAELDNPLSKNVRGLLNMIRDERNAHMKVCSLKMKKEHAS